MLKVGVIGAGRWGVNHVRVYSELDCELIGIADSDISKKELAEKLNIKFFKDYKDLLEKVDAVSIVVPTDIHYRIVRECLDKGKHVLVEKPITLDHKEAVELIKSAKDKNLILKIGYLYRFNSAVNKVKEEIKKIGNIQYIVGRYIHSNKPPRKDCGVIFNFGIHLMDIITYLLDQKPKSVYCKKGNFLSDKLEDYAFILLDYGKFSANLEMSWLHPEKRRDFWIIGSKAKIYADLFNQTVKLYPIEISPENISRGDEVDIAINKNDPLKDEIKDFCECIKKSDVEEDIDGAFSVKLCELSLQSAAENMEIKLDKNE